MILIAHRGNTTGIDIEKENNPKYIDNAINMGYNVEVDVRKSSDNKIYLGHDFPQYEINLEWICERSQYLWIHAKDIMSLQSLTKYSDKLNVFWHQQDDYTLTTRGYIWTYPGNILTSNSVCVMPENTVNTYTESDLMNCAAICSDYVEKYKKRCAR